jgi:hypothetical protein
LGGKGTKMEIKKFQIKKSFPVGRKDPSKSPARAIFFDKKNGAKIY